ncbi:AAA family ATPase [Photobacterium lipolyticum]|uniref:ATP-binding protein n=1 Tax=Photobacterium lipolyticum TaxID=266810 RepID=A0A2T3MW63_9GAMM|nr:AAA family ATPase [Photobacterium lipolyticum]PSW04194.1 ATP-binding protein [Photobacterium lipolyticum]
MTKQIKIKKIKHINELTFNVPSKGVYVLTGTNGTGKTTLLAALYRIGFSNAFAHAFKTTAQKDNLDSFSESSVTYHVQGEEVCYNYGNTRWSPTPRNNSTILDNFGYPEVRFIAADSKRIEATQDELKTSRTSSAENYICDAMVDILSDQKFKHLKYINTKRGRGNRAYLIQTQGKRKTYFSEKNFSLGELCVLRLVTNLSEIKDGSLVLIDEIEMALHPKAQAAMFSYLQVVAEDKKLTVIFSTHSASLIKRTPREKILLLKNNGSGVVSCERNVFPAQALGQLAFDDEVDPDFIFFVEDLMAKTLLERMIEKYKDLACKNRIPPLYKVVPIGGFKNVIEFLDRSDYIFGENVVRYAFLDKDVEEESMAKALADRSFKFLLTVDENKNNIRYLPSTPEKGVIDLLLEDIHEHEKNLQAYFDIYKLELHRILSSPEFKQFTSKNPRDLAKKQFSHLVSKVSSRANIREERLHTLFFQYYTDQYFVGENCIKKELSEVLEKRYNR